MTDFHELQQHTGQDLARLYLRYKKAPRKPRGLFHLGARLEATHTHAALFGALILSVAEAKGQNLKGQYKGNEDSDSSDRALTERLKDAV